MRLMVGESSRIKRRIRELAREYGDSGYRVVVEPADSELPGFLKGFRPDLIAFGEPESVVVEVKAGAELPGSRELMELATKVEEQPGWRLDLVVSNPRDKRRLEGTHPWEPSDISRYLNESLAIGELGHTEAAFLLLWAATEALLRRLAQRENLDVPVLEAPRQLVNQLTAAGAIARKDYETLMYAADTRNRVVHGIGPTKLDNRSLERLARVSERLLAELRRAA